MKKMLNARQTPIPPPVEVVQERSVHTQVLQVNDRVVLQDGRRGIVKYIGLVSFAPGQWAGVRLLLPTGRNDGSVDGRRYFTCDPNYGCFVRLATLHQ
jgi:dynactin complex subunit